MENGFSRWLPKMVETMLLSLHCYTSLEHACCVQACHVLHPKWDIIMVQRKFEWIRNGLHLWLVQDPKFIKGLLEKLFFYFLMMIIKWILSSNKLENQPRQWNATTGQTNSQQQLDKQYLNHTAKIDYPNMQIRDKTPATNKPKYKSL